MRSSNRSAEADPTENRGLTTRHLGFHLLLIAALVVLARAPFLVHGDRFFDSDEAVEGLMARHVLTGEFPAFLWGQGYKGVPEIYLTSAVFAMTGSNVVALKSVTLAVFVLFVCLQFVLIERLFSRPIAWLSTAFLITGPPSLVFWSLSGNAEMVMTLLAGTILCLGFDVWRRSGRPGGLVVACVAAGFGFWVQQFILFYVVALGLAVLHSLPQRQRLVKHIVLAKDVAPWVRVASTVLAVAAAVYVVLGAVAFLTGGFDVSLSGRTIGARHAQKMWLIAAALIGTALLARVWPLLPRDRPSSSLRYLAPIAFALGCAPALAARVAGNGSVPIGRTDLKGVVADLAPLSQEILPIVTGLRAPSTAWLPVWAWLTIAFGAALGASVVAIRERPFTPLFHFMLITAPLLFLVSGAFVDAQSYRYLMPVAGAFAVVLGVGVWRLFRWSRIAGIATFATITICFAAGQRVWYRQLPADTSNALITCLDHHGVRAAFADYWVSYKLTFLADERIIVAPDNGVDRYPRYTAYVRSQPAPPRIPDRMGFSCSQDTSSPR
jgi:hypothetical protein